MAEILGAVSAVVGIAAFATQVVEKLDALNAIYKYNRTEAAGYIKSLTSHLNILRLILQSAQSLEGHPAVDQAIVECQETYSSIDLALENILQRFSNMPPGKGAGLKSVKLLFSRDIRREVEKIESKLDFMNKTLTLSLVLYSIQDPRQTVGDSSGESTTAPALNQSTFRSKSFIHDARPREQNTEEIIVRRATQVQRASCSRQYCHCSCHLTEEIRGHYWGFEFTPFSDLFGKCDNKECTARSTSWKARFALNKFRIPCALVIGLKLVSSTGTFTIQPALSLERVVKYTSTGFEILWKCRNNVISPSQARESFYELYQLDNGLKNHVNPDGKGYVQELLMYGPWRAQDRQFALLRTLVRDFGMTLENQDQSFLLQCAGWIGEGRHLGLLDVILECGFDPSNINSPSFQRWPPPLSPNWISEELTPDPFFIEYLAALAKASPGFAGFTALHDAVLLQSVNTVRRLISSSDMLEEDLNFLGQTPLHLASVNQEISRLLLDAGHRIDTTDKHGITPLMYAAGMGNSQVAQMLILQGADTTRSDARWNRNFIAYASVRGHWSLIFESLDTIRTCYTQRSFHYFVNHALMELIVDNTWIDDLRRAEYFEKLVNLCEDVNLTFENSNTGTNRNNLLHYVRNQKEAQALIHRGFSGFNQPNSDGKLAMNSLVQCPNVELTRYCLENGSYVNHVDLNGRTVIFHLISQLGNYSWLIWDTVDSIKLCLARGADVFLSDNCDCPCVLDGNGCHTSSAFDLGFNINRYGSPPGFMWALEWISIVEDFLGLEASKTMLLSFLRRTQAGMIDITHFCCHRGKGVCERDYGLCRPRILSNEDIREILDEEEEFLEILEEDMQSWEHQSLDIIRSQWMVLLKRKHKVEVKKATEERRDRRQLNQLTHGVDHKSDRFVDNVSIFYPDGGLMIDLSTPMAEYAFWLQHEYFRSRTSSTDLAKEGWYERRMSWFRELMDVMQVRDSEIIKRMFEINITESRSEQVDQKAIAAQFGAYFRSTELGIVDLNT